MSFQADYSSLQATCETDQETLYLDVDQQNTDYNTLQADCANLETGEYGSTTGCLLVLQDLLTYMMDKIVCQSQAMVVQGDISALNGLAVNIQTSYIDIGQTATATQVAGSDNGSTAPYTKIAFPATNSDNMYVLSDCLREENTLAHDLNNNGFMDAGSLSEFESELDAVRLSMDPTATMNSDGSCASWNENTAAADLQDWSAVATYQVSATPLGGNTQTQETASTASTYLGQVTSSTTALNTFITGQSASAQTSLTTLTGTFKQVDTLAFKMAATMTPDATMTANQRSS